MKIGVVGCGAIGSYYGAKLLQAGNETWFLLRSDYEKVAADGVFIESVDGDFHIRPHVARRPEEIGVCDMVFIGLKSTANQRYRELLTPLVGPQTLIVTLQNGLGNVETLAELFGPDNIIGGLCFVCLNRIKPGHIHHIKHGNVVLGEYGRKPLERTHQISNMFQSVGVSCQVAENLLKTQWEKLIWNIPYNGLGVAACAGYETVLTGGGVDFSRIGGCMPTDQIHADPRWEKLLIELMREVVTAANALNLGVSEDKIRYNVDRTQSMGSYWASTLLDFVHRKPIELDSIFKYPLEAGARAGVEMPRLKNMLRVLIQLSTLCK